MALGAGESVKSWTPDGNDRGFFGDYKKFEELMTFLWSLDKDTDRRVARLRTKQAGEQDAFTSRADAVNIYGAEIGNQVVFDPALDLMRTDITENAKPTDLEGVIDHLLSLEVNMRAILAMTRTLWYKNEAALGVPGSGVQRAVKQQWTRSQSATFAILEDIMSSNPPSIPAGDMPSKNSPSAERNTETEALHRLCDKVKARYYTYINGLNDMDNVNTTWLKLGADLRARMLRELWEATGIPPPPGMDLHQRLVQQQKEPLQNPQGGAEKVREVAATICTLLTIYKYKEVVLYRRLWCIFS